MKTSNEQLLARLQEVKNMTAQSVPENGMAQGHQEIMAAMSAHHILKLKAYCLNNAVEMKALFTAFDAAHRPFTTLIDPFSSITKIIQKISTFSNRIRVY